MIASLPMYDRPELRAETDRLWSLFREALGHGPEALDRGPELFAVWESPDLVLSQTCGLPLRRELKGRVSCVASPDFGLEGCAPGLYRSLWVVRKGDSDRLADHAGRRFVANELTSQSGWAGPLTDAASRGITFGSVAPTGAHLHSIAALDAGQADIACVDAHTWRLACRYDDAPRRLQVIDATPPTPATPYITALGRDSDAHYAALATAIDRLGAEGRTALGLQGITRLPLAAYHDVPTPEAA
ncbi:phosphate/phosphite/phosphonate ABC transporter substrate-binding protein [Mesobacterium pallidum]|uniref:phosphate/phosphite/phosphonate ABC transporter substrate-binding protein n=1 Tax=Mesobacterium pallidum TaxID=2872037 RepID=UPI001EE2AD53|nr:PhnD/SsuA/transferrin family substrate-binding protein [Mesobacterium pallidum]